jgi:hypothetical protein
LIIASLYNFAVTQLRPDAIQQILKAYLWATDASGRLDEKSPIAGTRDIFRARLDRLYREIMKANSSESDGALLTAVVGEIGNNWWILLADRGQGILSSLGRVDPSIQTDQAALEAAFSRILSGRYPEKRGNGLKFVKQIINGDSKRGLLFLSGKGRMILGSLGPLAESTLRASPLGKIVPGTWALILGASS